MCQVAEGGEVLPGRPHVPDRTVEQIESRVEISQILAWTSDLLLVPLTAAELRKLDAQAPRFRNMRLRRIVFIRDNAGGFKHADLKLAGPAHPVWTFG